MKKQLLFGLFLFNFLKIIAQPPNDLICNAIALPVTEGADPCPANLQYVLTGATYSTLTTGNLCVPVANNSNPDIWFKFTTSIAGSISVFFKTDQWSNADLSYIQIISETSCNNLYGVLDCWPITESLSHGIIPRAVNYVNANQEYFLRLIKGGSSNNISICITSGLPVTGSRVGINNSQPGFSFDVAGPTKLRNNVGIGTDPSAIKLDVAGDGRFISNLSVGGLNNDAYYDTKISNNSINFYGNQTGPKLAMDWRYNDITSGIGYYANPAVQGSNMIFYSSFNEDNFIFGRGDPFYGGSYYFTEWMRLQNNGNLGIGTAAPDAKLHVAGSIKMVDGNQAAGKVLTSDANGLASWQPDGTGYWSLSGNNIGNTNTANVGIGTNAPVNKLTVSGNADITGNLGLGITLPAAKLDVQGTAYFRGSLNISHFNLGVPEDTYIRGGKSGSKIFINDISGAGPVYFGANIGIGNGSPLRPLSFPASLGEKHIIVSRKYG
ncbi:MAG: hypothetical protein ABJA78_03920 [Ferruginibacter sp.]